MDLRCHGGRDLWCGGVVVPGFARREAVLGDRCCERGLDLAHGARHRKGETCRGRSPDGQTLLLQRRRDLRDGCRCRSEALGELRGGQKVVIVGRRGIGDRLDLCRQCSRVPRLQGDHERERGRGRRWSHQCRARGDETLVPRQSFVARSCSSGMRGARGDRGRPCRPRSVQRPARLAQDGLADHAPLDPPACVRLHGRSPGGADYCSSPGKMAADVNVFPILGRLS